MKMADPSDYTPSYSFSGYQETNPAKPLPAPQIDVQFQDVSQATTELRAAVMDVRRSDGALNNGIVNYETLSDSARQWIMNEATKDGAQQALDAAAAAAASAAAASDDAEQTGADRAQTGLDAAAAASSASAASSSASAAATSATTAQTARDASIVNAQVYSSISAGLAAVADGATFDVIGNGNPTAVTRYRRTNSSTYTYVTDFPSASGFGYVLPGSPNEGFVRLSTLSPGAGAPVTHGITWDGRHRFFGGLDMNDMPPGVKREAIVPIFGVSLVRTTEDGRYVLSYVTDDGRTVNAADANAVTTTTAATAAYGSGTDYFVTRDRMWSQWIWPAFVEDADGNYTIGSLGRTLSGQSAWGRILVEQSNNGDAPKTTIIGRVEASSYGKTDDHNKAAVLPDPRPTAPYPLMAFQTDHAAKTYVRQWKSTTADPAGLVQGSNIGSGGAKTYQQLLRKPDTPDTIDMLLRHTSGSADGLWSIYTSTDNSSNWTIRSTLLGVTSGGLYVAWVPLANGDRAVMCYGHPTNGLDHVIRVARLTWAGALSGFDGTSINGNLYSAGSPVNPFTASGFTTVRNPGTKLTRYFAMWEFGTQLDVYWAEFDFATASTFDGYYYRGSVNTSTGVTTVTQITRCGGKIDDRDESSYIAGCEVIDANTVVCARWMGTYGEIVVCKFNGTSWSETTLDRLDDRKIFRPVQSVSHIWDGSKIVYARGRWLSYLKGRGTDGGYSDFGNFNADAVTLDINTFL